MQEDCDIKERWSSVDGLIERWLSERQALIVQFCLVSGVQLLSPRSGSNRSRLQQFCQLLLDYVSAGHFEIYYELLREAEAFDDGSAEAAKTVLPEITTTTEAALDFNDRYADASSRPTPELAQDLSHLGELLATRFDLEDRLISALHHAHRERVA